MVSLIDLGLATPAYGMGKADAWLDSLALSCLQAYLMEADLGMEHAIPEPVRHARTLIETRFTVLLSVEMVATEVALSSKHLVRLFRKHFGITPARLLWRVRIRHGIQLLTDTGLTVAEIAYRSGFQNPFHFSRMVKQETGRSPREFRNERWNPPQAQGATTLL